MITDYLKIGQAADLTGKDYVIYRILEILPGFLSWTTLLVLLAISYFQPVWAAFFLIAFDVYWLLLVIYLGIHLISAYRKFRNNVSIDWSKKLESLASDKDACANGCLAGQGVKSVDILHMIILPNSYEGLDVIRPTLRALLSDGFPPNQMMIVYGAEGRAGNEALERAEKIRNEFASYFRDFLITIHPDGLPGEIKGKGANQAWAAKKAKELIVDSQGLDDSKILVSIFDIDTIVEPGYFSCLTYKFLTVNNPYRASYQPVPVYHNNIWRAAFFSRVAASSNTFWQMMQQIRDEKLATYSSHSMTWRALLDVGFWSTNMVSEDSRIFWHCYCHYNGDYRVEPLHFPVSMDAAENKTWFLTAKNLYKQQRRWGWGVENIPYLIFNYFKRREQMKNKGALSKILVQLYGFHSWATNALIIGVIGWMPMILGGDRFNISVLSANLPYVTRTLMMAAMSGLILSAVIFTMLLPSKPDNIGRWKLPSMILQWLILPFSIILFGAIPGLDAQTRLMFNKRLGFQVTPKGRLGGEGGGAWDQTA